MPAAECQGKNVLPKIVVIIAIPYPLVYTTLMDSGWRNAKDVCYRKTYKTADRGEVFKCG